MLSGGERSRPRPDPRAGVGRPASGPRPFAQRRQADPVSGPSGLRCPTRHSNVLPRLPGEVAWRCPGPATVCRRTGAGRGSRGPVAPRLVSGGGKVRRRRYGSRGIRITNESTDRPVQRTAHAPTGRSARRAPARMTSWRGKAFGTRVLRTMARAAKATKPAPRGAKDQSNGQSAQGHAGRRRRR